MKLLGLLHNKQKEKNLIDEIMFEETTIKLSASADVTNLLPLEVITAVRNGKLAKEPKLTEVSNDYVTKDDLNKVLEQLKKDIQPKTLILYLLLNRSKT